MFDSVSLWCGCTLSFDSSSVYVPPLHSDGDVTVFIIHSCWDYGPHHFTPRTGGKRRESKKDTFHIYFHFVFYFFFFLLISLEACCLRNTGHWYCSFQLPLCCCSLGLFGSLSLYLIQRTHKNTEASLIPLILEFRSHFIWTPLLPAATLELISAICHCHFATQTSVVTKNLDGSQMAVADNFEANQVTTSAQEQNRKFQIHSSAISSVV